MRTLLLFDGLGGTNDTLAGALRELYARPENAAYFHTVFTVLDDIWRYVGNETRAAVLPTEFSLKQWLDFYFTHEDVFTRKRVSWAFLSNSILFHSARRVRDDLGFIGPMPGAEALQVPVYATGGLRPRHGESRGRPR